MGVQRIARVGVWIAAGALVAGCASRRLLTVENRLLQAENTALTERLKELERTSPDPEEFVAEPNLEVVHTFLTRAGYVHTYAEDANHIRLDYAGRNTSFSVTIQHFTPADVLYLATTDYLTLADAQDTRSLVLLFIQMATLNYELLLGKFQLNSESGEVLLSTELHVADGLGYGTLVSALDHLCQTADSKFPDLERAAAGTGL